jgi:hypothetical protein
LGLLVTVRWLKHPEDSKWPRQAAKLRAQPGVEMVVDVVTSNPSRDRARIEAGVYGGFKPPGHFHARVVGGEILAYYLPPGTPQGDQSD